jgi:hypothetical protein
MRCFYAFSPSLRSVRSRLYRLCLGAALVGALAACSDPASDALTLPDLAPVSGEGPMFFLGLDRLPLKPPIVTQLKYEYYECGGLISEWFLKLLVAEMNFLEMQSDLVPVDGSACAIGRAINQGQAEPRFVVYLFNTRKEANDCVVSLRCKLARNITLVPRDKAVWRSYFLSDFDINRFYQHCLAPPQKWHKGVSCDGVV